MSITDSDHCFESSVQCASGCEIFLNDSVDKVLRIIFFVEFLQVSKVDRECEKIIGNYLFVGPNSFEEIKKFIFDNYLVSRQSAKEIFFC